MSRPSAAASASQQSPDPDQRPPSLGDRVDALARLCSKLNQDIDGLSGRLTQADTSCDTSTEGDGPQVLGFREALAEANAQLELALSDRRVQRLKMRSLEDKNDLLLAEVDQLTASLRRSERSGEELAARNKSLEGCRQSSLDLHMQLLQANARLDQLGSRLDNERTRTRFAQEQTARLRRELAIARVDRDHPPQSEQAS